MAGLAGYVALYEELLLFQFGIKEQLHAKIQIFYSPQNEVFYRADRSVSIEYFQSVSLDIHFMTYGFQRPRRFFCQKRTRLFISIDAVADKIVRGIVADLLYYSRHIVCQ